MTQAAAGTGRAPRSACLLGLIVLLSVLGVAGFAALGLWQVQRLGWKQDLIARVERRIAAAPVPAPAPGQADRTASTRDDAYLNVQATGVFLSDRSAYVQAVTERGAGFWLLTPLRTGQGFTVLVNRGFVTPQQRKVGEEPSAMPVDVTGLLRLSEPGGGFLRRNDPAGDRWYSRDVAAIASARGLGEVAPYFIDADATPNPGGFPVGGLTVLRFANNHLVYALTWFALALMLAAAAVFVIRAELRPRREEENGY